MDVSLLYFDGCPNWQRTRELLREALDEVGRSDDAITLRRVETPEQAERLSFHGSPTILINGQDPFAEPTAATGLACRVYQTDSGLAGSPTREQLTEALKTRT